MDFEIAVHEAARSALARDYYQCLSDAPGTSMLILLAKDTMTWFGYKIQTMLRGSGSSCFSCLCFLKPEIIEECFVFDIFADDPENEKARIFMTMS